MKTCAQCGTRFTQPVAFCPHDGTPTQDLESEPPPDPLLGRVIDGRYRVERILGEGGMGVVYLISHAVLGKRMALKVLRGEMAKDADVVQRFIQEAQSATSIGHPNIIDISDFGKLPDGSVYFVMEYLDGNSLSKVIARGGSLPMTMAIHVIRQIASALDAAHARGIVHRDLKPDNIYLVKQGSDEHFVKVLDFGIAKVGGASSKLTRTGMIFGTPHYMSPEQASGQSIDRRTDVYALGVIMYEMFTGKVPFDGDTFMGILAKHMFEPPVPPSQVKGHSLGAIEDVILKALAKKVDDRYASMAELIADLDRIASGGSPEITLPPSSAPTPEGLANALEPPTRTEMRITGSLPWQGEDNVSLRKSRGAMIAIAVIAIVVVGAGVGGVVFWLSGSPATAASGAAATSATNGESGSATGSATGSNPPDTSSSATGSATGSNPPNATASSVLAPAGTAERASASSTTSTATSRSPEARTIEIVSEPAGAEVTVDGALVGNTPVQLPAPREGIRIAQVRMRGYETQQVMLSAASPESLRVTLARVNTGGTRRPHGTGSGGGTATSASESGSTSQPRTRPRSEVVDPWAD